MHNINATSGSAYGDDGALLFMQNAATPGSDVQTRRVVYIVLHFFLQNLVTFSFRICMHGVKYAEIYSINYAASTRRAYLRSWQRDKTENTQMWTRQITFTI